MKKKDLENKENISWSSSAEDLASQLFERRPDEKYIEEWTRTISQRPSVGASEIVSVLVFRLGQEWLALPTTFCKKITHRRPVHLIPHRQGNILQGIVNLDGKLELYIALHELLQIKASIAFHSSPYQRDRMMAIVKNGELWVFPVDEVDNIYYWNLLELENVPVNIFKSSIHYIKGVMNKENKTIGLLNEELLFADLKRSIQ